MNKAKITIGYLIGCGSCLIGGLVFGHLSAMYKYASNEKLIEIGCKDGDPTKPSYLKYEKNVLRDAKDLFLEII